MKKVNVSSAVKVQTEELYLLKPTKLEGKRYMILGKNGMLGRELQEVFHDRDFVAFNSKELDIRNEDELKAQILNVQPDVIINAAGYTDVNKAEQEQELANQINGYAVGKLAKVCRDFEITLVHFSTDYVFNGKKKEGYREDDLADPINAYGRSKLLGESLLLDEMESEHEGIDQEEGKFFLIRTSYLIGQHGKNIVTKLLQNAAKREQFKVVDDQFFKVSFAYDLAKQIKWLIESGEYESGVYHVTNSAVVNPLEFARTLLQENGFDPMMAVPCSLYDWESPAQRPQYSVLINTKLPELRHWKEALKAYLQSL
jgi:dTDP-4-dehydrorhamnose reductase